MSWWRRWTRWSERTPMERVEMYTLDSLYLIQASLVIAIVVRAVVERPEPVPVTVLLLASAAITAVGLHALHTVSAAHVARESVSWQRLATLAAVSVAGAGVALLLPTEPRGGLLMVVWSNLAIALGGLRDRRVLGALVVVLGLLLGLTSRSVFLGFYGAGFGAFLIFTVQASLWLLGVVAELDRARRAQAELAVAEERLRFSRDVHDVLGRSLSTIAVQAELAATLAERQDPRAVEQARSVQRSAHEGLREARALARGYRPTDLTQEVDGATSLLASAGIAMHVDLDQLPETWREPAGWVVREAVTNVLRHSQAREVRLEHDGEALVVRNDGVRESSALGFSSDGAEGAEGAGGTGLVGLRERLEPLGTVLEVRREGDAFELRVPTPASGPAEVPAGG